MNVREKLVEQLRWWSAECDRTNFGCQARKLLVEAADYIANSVTVQEWISVEDRLPRKEEFVLFLYAKDNRNPTLHARNTMAVGRLSHGMFIVDGCLVKITHWMPLPEPPDMRGET